MSLRWNETSGLGPDRSANRFKHDSATTPEQYRNPTSTVLFRSPLAWVTHVRHRPETAARSPETIVDANCIMLTTWGVYILHTDGERIVADANQAIFLNAGRSFRSEHPGAIGDDCLAFSFPEAVIADAIRVWDPTVDDRCGRIFDRISTLINQNIYLRQRALASRVRNPGGFEPIEIEEECLTLLSDIIEADHGTRRTRRSTQGETSLVHREVAEGVKALLSPWSTESKPPRLESLAKAIGYSPFYLCRMFKSYCGETIHQYLERLRLRAALDAIEETEQDIGEIAVELGYSSHSHFTLAFRREFGVLPSRLRADPSLLQVGGCTNERRPFENWPTLRRRGFGDINLNPRPHYLS